MLLDLEDDQVRCRISEQVNGKLRLTLDYPHTAEYRRRVMTAVSDLIRPKVNIPLTKEEEEE